jgi:hypothetical protein
MRHYEGTALAGGAPLKVSLTRRGVALRLFNRHAADLLEVSFDGGTKFYPVKAASELAENALFHFFFVRAPGGNNISWSALVAEG